MRKRILGALTFIAAVGGVIYMKNNPKYKEIIQTVKTADARGLYEKIIFDWGNGSYSRSRFCSECRKNRYIEGAAEGAQDNY